MNSASDPYKTLGLSANATEAEIKQAYRKLARQWHPDQFQNPSEKQKAEAEIKRINIAYSQLKDPSFQPDSSPSAGGSGNNPSGNSSVKKDSQAQRQARAQSYYRQAETLEKSERYQDATKALTLAINLVPDYAKAYQYRAYLYDLRGFEFLAAKDKKKAKTLGLEKTYRSSPEEASPPSQKKSAKRWRPKGWGESSRPKSAASAPPQSQAKSTRSPAQSASSTASPNRQAPATSTTSGSSSTSVFSFPQPMAAVSQTWNSTATLKSPTGNRPGGTASAGAITQLLPYGSTNGISTSANGLIQLWNFERGYDFADLKGHSDEICDLDLNADGQLLASASKDGTIKLWHLSSASLTRSFEAGSMTSLVFGPERHSLSCCNASGEVRQWNSRQESQSPLPNSDRPKTDLWASRAATYIGLSANRKILISRSSDRSLHRYLLEESVPSRQLPESQFEQTYIALSPSSRHIAAGDRTGLIRLWNLQTAEPIMAIQGHAGVVEAIAFTPDNRLIASLCKTKEGETLVQLWSRPSREHLCDIPGDGFTSLCFSGDSKRLIIGTATGELKIWQPALRP